VKFRRVSEVLPASFTEKVLGKISRVVHPKTKRFAVKFRRVLEILCLARFIKKSSGRIFSIFSSKSEAVCRWVQMHSGCSLLARFTVKVLGAIPRFTIYVSKTKRFAVEFRRILEAFALPA